MNLRFSSLVKALPLVGFLLPLAASCQSVAGIEDYRLGHCGDFCRTVMENCKNENQVYHTFDTCMGFCALLREGEFNEKDTGNTVACRLDAARSVPGGEADVLCQWAGPGGGTHCGASNCDNYCALLPKVCPDEASHQDPCLTNCQGLRDDLNLSSEADHEGDTIECRLVHLSAATTEPSTHCAHAQLANPGMYCRDQDLKTTPHPLSCDDYCKLIGKVCTGNNAVYEDNEQCKAVCKYFPVGEFGDTTGDTLACRKYHTYNSIATPATHCAHAGPGGDGHCGDNMVGNCTSYCNLLSQVCPDEFTTALTDVDGCMADCANLEDSASNKSYSVEKTLHPQAPVPFGCRLLSLTRAAVDKTLCSVVFDETTCQ